MSAKELLETGTITKEKPNSKSKYTTKELYERIEELYTLANEIKDRVRRL